MAAKKKIFPDGHIGEKLDILEGSGNAQVAYPVRFWIGDILIVKQDSASLGRVELIDTIEDGKNSWLHLMPVVWKGRLMIFWPVFREKSKSSVAGSDIKTRDLADKKASDLEPIKYWEI